MEKSPVSKLITGIFIFAFLFIGFLSLPCKTKDPTENRVEKYVSPNTGELISDTNKFLGKRLIHSCKKKIITSNINVVVIKDRDYIKEYSNIKSLGKECSETYSYDKYLIIINPYGSSFVYKNINSHIVLDKDKTTEVNSILEERKNGDKKKFSRDFIGYLSALKDL